MDRGRGVVFLEPLVFGVEAVDFLEEGLDVLHGERLRGEGLWLRFGRLDEGEGLVLGRPFDGVVV